MTTSFRAEGRDAERMIVIGKTGSGKTELVKLVAAQAERVMWWDTKRLNEGGFGVAPPPAGPAELAALLDAQPHVTVQPDPNLNATEQLDALAHAVYEHGNVLFVVDDAMNAMGVAPPHWINNIVTMGRSRGIGLISIVQRAHHIPRVLLTEAEHVVAFELHGESDVKRLREEVAQELEQTTGLQRFHFAWYSRGTREITICPPLPL